MNTYRRNMMKSFGTLALLLSGCRSDEPSPHSDSDPDAALRHRFRGVGGGELRIDAFEPVSRIALYLESGLLLAAGVFSRGAKTSGYGGHVAGDSLVVPRTLRMVRYAPEARRQGGISDPVYDGDPILDVTVPVAERIPDAALDRVRKYKGSLALKLRIHPKTLLVGWEVRNGKGYPFKRDLAGNAYTTDEDRMVGGDFREARVRRELLPEGGARVIREPGWYIDPETGERIVADF